MQSATCILMVLAAATLIQFGAVAGQPSCVDDYNFERELGLLAVDLLPIVDIDLTQCIKLMLSAAAGNPQCDDDTIECYAVSVVYDVIDSIGVNPIDVIAEICRAEVVTYVDSLVPQF